MRPVQFNWKAHPVHDFNTTTPTVGFIAQDLQVTLADKPYLNSIVKENECVIQKEIKDEEGNIITPEVKETFYGIAEGNLIAILTSAVQGLTAELNDLKARISVLEGNA